jgi:hypothetical protein
MTDQRGTMTKIRFSREDAWQCDATARVAPGHTITKERVPAQRRSESGFAVFRCTCGWKAQTATGVSNTLAEMHAREVETA